MACTPVSTTAITVANSQLVLTIPSGSYNNCQTYCITLAQSIPTTVTGAMNVVVQIGAGTTMYPIMRRCGHFLYANQVTTNSKYAVRVNADASTFTLVCGQITNHNCGSTATIS